VFWRRATITSSSVEKHAAPPLLTGWWHDSEIHCATGYWAQPCAKPGSEWWHGLGFSRHRHGRNGGVLASPRHVCTVNGGAAKFSMPAFNGTLVPSLCSKPLVKVPARDSALVARPVLSSTAAERHINGRSPTARFLMPV
jgi:hypothetical protein